MVPRPRGTSALVALAALLVAVLVTAYFTFESTTPDGVDIVFDPAKISAFHARFNGRYGAPPGTVLALADGKLTGLGGGAGTPEEPRFAFTYRYALRGDQVVLVLSNGALLETELPGAKLVNRGKVRDIYDLGDSLLFVATDRISAFDCVMPNGIPGKGFIRAVVAKP